MAYQKTDLPGNPVFDPETGQYGYEISPREPPYGTYILWSDEPIPFGEDDPDYDPESGFYTYQIVFADGQRPIKVNLPEPPLLYGTRIHLELALIARRMRIEKAIAERLRALDAD